MKKVNGADFLLVVAALQSVSSSTYLEVSWHDEEEKGQIVRVDGLNQTISKRTYEVYEPDEPLPWRKWLVRNNRYAVVISWWYDEPSVPINEPVEWMGWVCVPWLVAPLAKRLKRDLGIWIPIDRPVWVARRKGE